MFQDQVSAKNHTIHYVKSYHTIIYQTDIDLVIVLGHK